MNKKSTYLRWLMVLTLGVFLWSGFSVNAQGLEILNPSLDMGFRPIGAWTEPARFEIVNNPGEGDLSVIAADINNTYGNFVNVVSPVLPYTIASGATTTEFGLTVNVEAAATAGTFNGEYALIFGSSRALATATYEGTAYVPIAGDVVENALLLTPTVLPAPAPLPSAGTREFNGWYKNYILPNDLGNSPDESDLVYKLTPTVDMLFNWTLTSGTANLALYAEDFEGEGGPMAHNAIVQNMNELVDIELSANNVYYMVASSWVGWGADYTLLPMPAPDAVTYVAPLDGAINITNGNLLSWTFGNNTSEYELVLGTTYPPTTVVVPYTSTLATSYALTGLQPNMQYFWRVNVKNTQGTTAGPVWGFTTTIDVPLAFTVTLVDPAATATTVTANLNWTGPSDRGFIGYNVYRDGVKLNTTPITVSEYTDLGLARNTTYVYTVSNVYDEGESALTAPVSVTTKGVGIFNGFVYNHLNNAPIVGARVDITGPAGTYSVLTAANGAYSTQAYNGTYSLSASATGFTAQTITGVALAHAATVSNNFLLMETPFAVGEVVAVELDANSVQISWSGSRAILSYDVWRQKAYQPGTLEKIGTTLGQQIFVDFSWGTQDWGVYQWAVTVNYDENQVSAPTFSNSLDKDMIAEVDVTVTLNSGDSPFGTLVTFTNTSEPLLELVYEETLGGSGEFTWNEFRKGVYNIDVVKAGYTGASLTNVEIFGDESFNWLLDELLAPPSDLYVTPTGYATWGGGVGASFVPMTQDFNDGFGEWTVQQTNPIRTWEIRTNATSNIDGTPYAYVYWQTNPQNELLVSPVMNATSASSLFIQFEQYYRDYTASIDVGTVEVYDGSSWVTVATFTGQSYGSYTAPDFQDIDVTAYKNANFQVRFRYVGHNDWYWAIDNVVVTDVPSRDRSFENYKVFLDGTLVADVTEAEYQFGTNGETLVDGQTYLAEVATVYTTGQSTKASYTWTYNACGNYNTPGNFSAVQVEGTLNVDLSWTIPTIPAADDQIDFARITRDGVVIIETELANYLDSGLNLGTYTYCITFVYESGAETCPATLCETVEVIGGGFVNGNVMEAAYLGGANIEGAAVTLTNVADDAIVFTFTTNASGMYSGEVLAGTYDYAVVANGYVSQSLEDVAIAQTATVTRNFVMMEFPYAVGNIVATEISDNAVEIDWTGTGGGGTGGTTAEWLYYDDGTNVDGIGGPATFTWAIKFDPAQLADYDGSSLTKISIYNRLSSPMILRICEGNNAATQVFEQTLSGLPLEAWSEVTLTTPVVLDVTKQLWITVYTADGANYPAACGIGMNQPNGDLITLDGTTWEHLTDYGLINTWNLRGFVTDMSNRSIELARTENTTVYDSNPVNSVFALSGQKNTSANASINNATRELQGFNVYRTTCETGDLQFLGYTLDSLFTDNTWGTMEAGVYKWGVEAVYDENNSEVSFSNCLDKDMVTAVSVTVITNSGDSPDRTDVTLTNTSEPGMNLVYEVRLDDTGYFVWEDFRKGTYDVVVEKNGFSPIMETVEIDGVTNLEYTLEELLNPVGDLHVSATGFATWRDGGVQPFDAVSFDFEADEQGWEIQGNVNGWQWGNNASLSSTYMTFNGNSTNFIAVNADAAGSGGSPIVAMAKSPVMNLENAEQIYLSFDYTLNSDAISVHYSLDGAAPVQIENLAASSGSWRNHVVMLPEEAVAENVQIIFLYTEASTWSYGGGVDNVTLTEEEPADALEYYKVWLDGIFIADVPTTFYQYDVATLTPGQEYFSEVAAVYSNGISEKMNYTWTFYACDSFPGPADLSYEIVDVNNVVLSWGGNTPPPPPGGDFFEDFEAGNVPTGWKLYDVDGDSYQWENTAVNYDVFDAHSGLYCMTSASYINNVGALTPNNWLVTPAIAVTATSELKFWIDGQDPAYAAEKYYVKVSTTGDAVANFTTTLHTAVATGNWAEIVVDLSTYAGQTIYIAFQHTEVSDMFFLKLDDVTVTNTATRAAQTSPLAAGVSNAVSFKTQGMSQSEIDARINQTGAYASTCVAEKTTSTGNTAIINGIGKSLASNRAVLFNNGPLVNSAGTGAGGADESILQGALGFTSYGFGVNNVSGQHLADDFVVDAEWTIESMEFFAYQTGSTTTSSLTGVYFQIYNGAPNAGGTVVFGDLTTNRMTSTSWTNIYRNDDGPAGSTNRPVMKAVANVTGLTLQPGTYWVEYTLTGSLGSGPWTPPITINGQTNTGNAIQFASGAWANLVDGTFPQGVPFIINGTSGGTTPGEPTFDPGEFLGANVYRNGDLIAEMVQGETYTDMEVEPGYYDYCVVFVYEDNAMSCMTTCVTDVLVTEDCQIPQNLTASATVANEVTLVWNEQTAQEFRYDDGTSTGQLGSGAGTLNTVLGAKHTNSAQLTEMSWYTTAEGGPHNTIQIYVFGLTSAGMPDGNNKLYTASVTNTDDSWNTHTFPTTITANGGFFIGIAYNGFAAIGTDDGLGAPYVFQPNTHYFTGDYTAGGWDTWETFGFNVNAMIRAIGVAGAKASYAVTPTVTPVEGIKDRMAMVYTSNEPVATGAPQWSTPARDMNRAFLGYNIYKDGSLLEALWPETTYVYQEGQGGLICYTVTAEYEYCGETDPSDEACVTLVDVKTNDLSQIRVYPNPANNTVNIDLTSNISQVVIYNYLGQVVNESNITDQTTLNVDVRNYEAGAYLVKLITKEGQSITKKVVVTK